MFKFILAAAVAILYFGGDVRAAINESLHEKLNTMIETKNALATETLDIIQKANGKEPVKEVQVKVKKLTPEELAIQRSGVKPSEVERVVIDGQTQQVFTNSGFRITQAAN